MSIFGNTNQNLYFNNLLVNLKSYIFIIFYFYFKISFKIITSRKNENIVNFKYNIIGRRFISGNIFNLLSFSMFSEKSKLYLILIFLSQLLN
jgi:hypothetical protein